MNCVQKKYITNFSGKTKRSAEFYIKASKRRQDLAAAVQSRATSYKASFKKVELICDLDTSIPGAIAQVQSAFSNIQQGLPNEASKVEFIRAAEHLFELHKAMRELEADGVPVLVSLELSRRVLDSDVVGSEEIMVADEAEDELDTLEDDENGRSLNFISC